jgi:hypothetical protein
MRIRPALLLVLSGIGLNAQPAPEAQPSFIAAPIRVDLAPLLAAAERSTPKVPPGVDTWTALPGMALGNPAYRFNLYRDPLYFVLTGKRLAVHTTVHYWMEVGLQMKGWVKGIGACGQPPETFRRARLGLALEVALTPDWGLDLKILPEEPLRLDTCQITVLGYDITDKVLAGMKDAMFKATLAMEQQLKASDLLRQRAAAVWQQALEPVELAPGVYLKLNPERIRLAPWQSQGKELIITPEIQTRPTLTLGPRPEVEVRPLPALDLSAAPIQPGFRMRVEADLSYQHASAQLAGQMVGKRFDTDKGSFEVLSAAVRGQGDQAILEIGLKGKVNGKLNLIGKPVFDPQTGVLQLQNLDYTLESQSWITAMGEWLFRSTLRKTLAEKCNWFMDKSFKDMKSQAERGLNRSLSPELSMAGSIDSFTLDALEVLADRFRVIALLSGQVQIAVKPGLPQPSS